MKDRRSLMRILAGVALLSVGRQAAAQKAKSFTIAYLALLPGEDRMDFAARCNAGTAGKPPRHPMGFNPEGA